MKIDSIEHIENEVLCLLKKINSEISKTTVGIMSEGIIDSIEFVELIELLESTFEINIDLTEVEISAFDSCEDIVAFVAMKKETCE